CAARRGARAPVPAAAGCAAPGARLDRDLRALLACPAGALAALPGRAVVRLHLVLEEDLPHPIERVWRALTDPAALAAWLMPNDFQARVGVTFRMTYPPDPALRGRVDIQVLALEPPRRMAWAWAFREGAP